MSADVRVRVRAKADELRRQGFTTFEALMPAELAARFAETLRGQWLRLGSPPIVSREDVHLEPGVHVSPVGMTCASILARIPELATLLLRPELLALFADLLGPGFVLEFGGGVMSDEDRPFFFWHHRRVCLSRPHLRPGRWVSAVLPSRSPFNKGSTSPSSDGGRLFPKAGSRSESWQIGFKSRLDGSCRTTSWAGSSAPLCSSAFNRFCAKLFEPTGYDLQQVIGEARG